MDEPQTTPHTKGSTSYVVLRRNDQASPSEEVMWTHVGLFSATNAASAIRLAAQADGAYVAIPKRSFGVTNVEVETQPRVRIIG